MVTDMLMGLIEVVVHGKFLSG